eukprot:GHRR01034762.1.p1 GENE.GHRR01034762.1~~GHRR01034762.1.p1  ORF type:complete len:117 (-),score=28.31 GHRR01034762.1:622-972(-)
MVNDVCTQNHQVNFARLQESSKGCQHIPTPDLCIDWPCISSCAAVLQLVGCCCNGQNPCAHDYLVSLLLSIYAGTGADLRRLGHKRAGELLLTKFNMAPDMVAAMPRWDRIDAIRR